MTDNTKDVLQGTIMGFAFGVLLTMMCCTPPPGMRAKCRKACAAEGHEAWALDHYKGCICADSAPKQVWSVAPKGEVD